LVSTAFYLGKEKLRHSLGRPSRSDFVQSQFVMITLFEIDKSDKKTDYRGIKNERSRIWKQ
jgi:hypothetical protein